MVFRLYRERLSQVNFKLAEVEAGRAAEYLDPLAVLLENMQVRTKVAGKIDPFTILLSHFVAFSLISPNCCPSGIYRKLCLDSVRNKYNCEIQAACQHWEVRNAGYL